MLTKSFSLKGFNLSAIYCGSTCVVLSNYYGILAIAERTTDFDDKFVHYSVSVGNHYAIGSRLTESVIFRATCKVVEGFFNQYCKHNITFTQISKDLAYYIPELNISTPVQS